MNNWSMRREVIEQVVYFLFVQVITSMLLSLPFGLFFMVGVDAVHAWWPQVPTIGYGDAYWLSVLFLMITSTRPSRRRLGARR